MKKRNIIAILASCAAVLTIFTACGSKEEDVTNPTVVGTDGKVYEEITEAVTDAEGEAVTDAAGETQVVVVTKPYTTKKAEKEKDKDKDDKTKAPDENPATPEVPGTTATPGTPNATTPGTPGATTPGTTAAPLFPFMTEPAGETTTTVDDVLRPEGEEVDVPLNQSGSPMYSKKDKFFDASVQNKSLYMDCAIVTNDNGAFTSGMNMKFYIKNNKMAIDFPVGVSKMRFAYDGNTTNIMIPGNYYYTLGETQSSDLDMIEELGFWSAISSDKMKYVKTTSDDEFLCEIYTDESGNTVKYYFDKNDKLKRMEIESPDKSSTIFKIKDVSTTVDDSVFSVPKNYELLTEDNFESIAGSLGLV